MNVLGSLGTLYHQSFQLYRKAFARVMPLSLGIAMIPFGATQCLYWLSQHDGMDISTYPLSPHMSMHLVTILGVGAGLLSILGAAVLLSSMLLVMRHQYSFGRALRKSLKVFPSLLVLYIIGIIAWILGGMMLIAPGIFLKGKWVYAELFVIDEQQGPIQALKTSWHRVSGQWWFSSLTMISPVMALFVIVFALLMMTPHHAFRLDDSYLATALISGMYALLAPFLASFYIHLAGLLEQRQLPQPQARVSGE